MLKIKVVENVLDCMNVCKYVEEIESKFDEEKLEFKNSIYSNLYVYELLVEYYNEGDLYNIGKVSLYWLKKSLKYLKNNSIIIKELEDLVEVVEEIKMLNV